MYEQVCYQKPFLKEVIVRVDFATPVEKLEKSVPPKLFRTIAQNFPIVEPADVLMHEVAIEGDSLRSKNTSMKQWSYFSKDRGQQLTLASQSFFLQYKKYNSFEDTKGHFDAVVDAMNSAFPGTMASRFGLRYINQIDLPMHNPSEWGKYIEKKLLCSRDFFDNDDAIARLISIAELKYGDMDVRFQFGMPNPDYPAPVKRPLFVLDLDASISQAHDLKDVMTYMDDGHRRIQTLFERSITESLREKMNAKLVHQ